MRPGLLAGTGETVCRRQVRAASEVARGNGGLLWVTARPLLAVGPARTNMSVTSPLVKWMGTGEPVHELLGSWARRTARRGLRQEGHPGRAYDLPESPKEGVDTAVYSCRPTDSPSGTAAAAEQGGGQRWAAGWASEVVAAAAAAAAGVRTVEEDSGAIG